MGITNRDISERLAEINSFGKNFEVVAKFYFTDGQVAYDLEAHLLEWLRSKYRNPLEKFDGYTECFIGVDTPLIVSKIRLTQ